MKKLTVSFKNANGHTETFETAVLGEDKFSAKGLRKGLHKHLLRLITLPTKHGVSRGSKIETVISFDGQTFAVPALYFGGYKIDAKDADNHKVARTLKIFLEAIVMDIAELVK